MPSTLFINDAEEGLLLDYKVWLEALAPHEPASNYQHNLTGEDNADAHLKRQIMGREVVVAITKGQLDFGPWEQIFYGEFDGNRKRVQRVRRQAGLQVVQKRAKSRRSGSRAERRRAQQPNEVWSYDFIHDQLENGGAMKMLTVLDEFTRECLGIWVARSITVVDVIAFLQELIRRRGAPAHVRSDNGPEFVAGVIQQWAQKEAIKINYIAPGSPWENGRVESFHGKFRGGCLNWEVFDNLLEA